MHTDHSPNSPASTGTAFRTVADITPAGGAVSLRSVDDLCKPLLTPVRLADFGSLSDYVKRIEELQCQFEPERVAEAVASLGPVEVEDAAQGEPHPDITGAMRIPLGNGVFAVIDADDYPLVKRHEWFLSLTSYAWTKTNHCGREVSLPMHRLILMLSVNCGLDVDHVSRDRLDNRKANLRACTRAENLWNQRKRGSNTSGIKGVCWSKQAGKWSAAVKANGKRYQKLFLLLEDAEVWVRAKREELHGEFARHE